MPAIWPSSERPISVRTVWVDGVRHIILSSDDPLLNVRTRQRPRMSIAKEKDYSVELYKSGLDGLDSCFVKLHVVLEKSSSGTDGPSRMTRRQSAPPCIGDSDENRRGAAELLVDDVSNLTKNNDDDSSEKLSETQSNPLSERVLQWLDLSGRAVEYDRSIEKTIVLAKSSPAQTKKLISCRRDNSVSVQNCRLQTERRLADGENSKRVSQKQIAKLQDSSRKDVPVARSYFSEKTTKKSLKVPEEKSRSEEQSQERQALWSPPGRPQLHIFMPTLNSEEKHLSSSLESLICD